MNKSFTLIEILVVIVIIGIISAFILVGMSSITNGANIAKSQAFVNSINNSLLLARVSQWKLDEVSSTTTSDSWGTNTGTLKDAVACSFVAPYKCPQSVTSGCPSNNCLSFDGTDDYVDFGSDISLSMGDEDQTVSLWVKFDNASAPKHESLIYCGGAGTGTDKDGYLIRRENGTSRLRCFFSDGSLDYTNGYLSAANTVVGNVWYNIVVVFNRANTVNDNIQAYINGVKQVESVDIHSWTLNVRNYIPTYIGGSASYFAGKLDDIRIYNQAIPLSEINQNYYIGINGLFKNQGISLDDFNQRLVELKSNLANNE